jgi:hypothetical protein
MDWKKLLAYISGQVDDELRLKVEYLIAENRILRSQLDGRLRLNDKQRLTLASIGKRLGRAALSQIASIVTPETILASPQAHRRQVRYFPPAEEISVGSRDSPVVCNQRLGGLLRFYHRMEAA